MQIRNSLMIGVFAMSMASTMRAADTVLPEACGSDAVNFSIKKEKSPAVPAPPAEGKARIIFVQVTVKQGSGTIALFGKSEFITRYGVDGSWTGAAGNNSYFAIEVPPGEHHVCASVQGDNSVAKRMVAAESFTAEAGNTYYFEFHVQRLSGEYNYYSSNFSRLKEDEGKYRVRALDISNSTPKH